MTPGETVRVEKLDAQAGSELELNALWSASNEDKAGDKLPQAKVVVKVLRHLRGPKIIVYKRRPKKAYEKTQGHRQELSEIQVKDIHLS